MIIISCSSAFDFTASDISAAELTFTTSTNIGGSTDTDALTSVTLAPRSIQFSANAFPIFPVEWFVIKRTGSIFSIVAPAVTSTCFPCISFLHAIVLIIYAKSVSGSGIFPAPVSPQARYPLAGSIISKP